MRSKILLCCISQLAAVGLAQALTIQLDYSLDTTNFFGTHATAQAALTAAASDLSIAITSTLGAIPTDTFTSTNGGTTANINWSLDFTHPTTGLDHSVADASISANIVRVYVGVQALLGTTLGVGGPAGGGLLIGGGGAEAQWVGVVAAAEAASNASMLRGAGPTISSITDSLALGGTTANYFLSVGIIAGSLWFDSDTDNTGGADDDSTLNSSWHFDHTTAVAGGKNDFYSVALHELLHSVGFGASETWDATRSGTTWNGAQAIALNGGSGVGLISGDFGHLASGVMSTRISDGMSQEAVMDPTLTTGTRKSLTQMDLAILRDLNYTTVPEPSTGLLLFVGLALLARPRASRRA